ncbi:unnamed protein product [Caenorhabditis angaria]|uniref:Uncharacterized protein n=1 Tax=Caenorhabditis angaria TaxID=860376 RepID=A0A9P1IBU8_9PELO|nr:unnamed protein product [Caenorhabditis angaria]
MDQRLLHCSETRAVPLSHNFYQKILEKNTVLIGQNSSASSNGASNTTKIVEHLLKTNEKFIEEAAMKQAAPNGVNINHQQYTNLIPLSFDEQEFIRNIEQQRKK